MMAWHRLPLPKNVIFLSQYLPLRILVALFQSLTIRGATGLGAFMGRIAYAFDKTHRNIALVNLDNAYRDKLSKEKKQEIVLEVYERLGISFAHATRLKRLIRKDTWHKYARFENLGMLEKVYRENRGVILVGGHLGNWEVALQIMGIIGYPIHAVAFRLINPMVLKLLENSRRYCNLPPVLYTAENATASSIKMLKKGELIAHMVDLAGRKQGFPAEFFGQLASTARVPAILSFKTSAPILPYYSYRIGKSFKYVIGFEEPIYPTPAAGNLSRDIQNVIQKYTGSIEKIIRRNPGEWIWFHKRWKKYRTKWR
ncbi:MAG: lysophospholipid acyltransferase family protein [Planctomycetes bacterium]|nr:lysophospholipid acyltransferase family protein [Planctomycetota bacterium]